MAIGNYGNLPSNPTNDWAYAGAEDKARNEREQRTWANEFADAAPGGPRPGPIKPTTQMQKLLASINNSGVQPSNRFEVRLDPPGDIVGPMEEIILRCESVTMPGRNLSSLSDANIYGPTREIVSGVTYAEDVTCSFLADGNFDIRRFFEAWQELAFNPRTWDVGYHEKYVGKVKIFTLDRNDLQRYGVTLIEAFPKTLGAHELNMTSTNELQKISVGFSFRYWESYAVGSVRDQWSWA